MADTEDSKSSARKGVRVQVPPPAPVDSPRSAHADRGLLRAGVGPPGRHPRHGSCAAEVPLQTGSFLGPRLSTASTWVEETSRPGQSGGARHMTDPDAGHGDSAFSSFFNFSFVLLEARPFQRRALAFRPRPGAGRAGTAWARPAATMPALCSRNTNDAAEPSRIGTSSAVMSTTRLSRPSPEHAESRCSTVFTFGPPGRRRPRASSPCACRRR